MGVKRIVSNIKTENIALAQLFYGDILEMEICMDHGWIRTYGSVNKAMVQISFATEGGLGTPVPDVSIEVDDLDSIYTKMKDAGFAIVYGPANEPWGVKRFYVTDPFGKLINILCHK